MQGCLSENHDLSTHNANKMPQQKYHVLQVVLLKKTLNNKKGILLKSKVLRISWLPHSSFRPDDSFFHSNGALPLRIRLPVSLKLTKE